MSISEYLSGVLNYKTLPIVVKNAKKFFPKMKFDSIVVRGFSGSLVASILAVEFKKNIVIVRKETEIDLGSGSGLFINSHSSSIVEYSEVPKKYIIVDDITSSGDTIKDIISQINEDAVSIGYNAECVGVFLYDQENDGEADVIVNELNEEFGLKMKLFTSTIF